MKRFLQVMIVVLSLCLLGAGTGLLINNFTPANVEQEEDQEESKAAGGNLYLRAYTFSSSYPSGSNNTVGGTVTARGTILYTAGTGAGTAYSYVTDKEYVRADAEVKSGYTFLGWYSDSSFTNLVSTATQYKFTHYSTTSLYAKFAQSLTLHIHVADNKNSYGRDNGGTISANIDNGNSSYAQTKSSSYNNGYGFYGIEFLNAHYGDTISIVVNPKSGYYYEGLYAVSPDWRDYADYTMTWNSKVTTSTTYKNFSASSLAVNFALSDTQAPTVSRATVVRNNDSSFYIYAYITDNKGVTKVQFPTWTSANGQDDLVWYEPSSGSWNVGGQTYNYRYLVNKSNHNGEVGPYIVHIYAYDAANNSGSAVATSGFTITQTVTLNQQSGSGGSTTVYATKGSAMPSITRPSRTGYTFQGYYTQTGGAGVQYYTASGASARNYDKDTTLTLYANWTLNTYTVKVVDGVTGSQLSSTTRTYNTAFSVSPGSKTGYSFTGFTVTSGLNTSTAKWGTTSTPTTAITSSSTNCVNGTSSVYFLNLTSTNGASVTITANWSARYYTLTINPNGGSYSGSTSNKTASVQYKSKYTLSTPTRSGYDFTGWKLPAGTTTSLSGNVITMGYGNVTVTAQWKEHAWTDSQYVASSYASGSGTQSDPYIIKTAGQLGKLSLDSQSSYFNGTYFKLGANIDLGTHRWEPIGDIYEFKGIFDGNMCTISNMRVTEKNTYETSGLFGKMRGTVKNLIMKNSTISAGLYCGTIAGSGDASTILNCIVDNSTMTGTSGGLIVGDCYDGATISNCIVKNSTVNVGLDAGCIFASGNSTVTVKNCGVYNVSLAGYQVDEIGNSVDSIGRYIGNYVDCTKNDTQSKKLYGGINDFGGFTYNQYLNEGYPVAEGLFAIGGQSGSANVYNYLVSKGFTQ